ncbi:hypothetical protein GCK72_007427 [Caenorhabditis remanei]|uniref:Uncharacterized protein n=1 Tax=Caenorhabditis remanei TaxID=31234 RepID=A0A6A5HHY4_CAERE|nr:hypothetical protein GCK72_007427 [Caenorhabditis remanei]KAF1767468.1 hypothetical protein GCK72_007427 [Caenorhabditis remanei]
MGNRAIICKIWSGLSCNILMEDVNLYRGKIMPGIVLLDELDPDQNKADVEYINDEELDFGDVEYENMEFRNAPTDMDPGN